MGRFIGTFIEERADWSESVIKKQLEMRQLKMQIKQATVTKRLMAEHFRSSITEARSALATTKNIRYKATINYKFKVADAKEQSTEWKYSPITAVDLKEAASKISPKRQARYENRQPVSEVKKVNGVKYTLFNGVFTKDTLSEIKKSSNNTRRYYEEKYPRSMVHHVGVEIEMVMSVKENELHKHLTKHNLQSRVNITRDGSIHPEKYNAVDGAELRIVDTTTDIYSTITKLCEMITSSPIKAEAPDSCGLHVHLDMRRRVAYDCFRNLVNCLPALRLLTPKQRRTNSFCKDNKTADLFKAKLQDSGSRYWAINYDSLNRHNTLEVRMHHGSVDSYVINSWIKLLNKIVDHGPILRKITTTTDLINVLKLDKELTAYVNDAFNKHNPSTAEPIYPVAEMRGA